MSVQVIDRAGKLSFNLWTNNGTAGNYSVFCFLFSQEGNTFLGEHKIVCNEITVLQLVFQNVPQAYYTHWVTCDLLKQCLPWLAKSWNNFNAFGDLGMFVFSFQWNRKYSGSLKTWQFTPTKNLLPCSASFLMKLDAKSCFKWCYKRQRRFAWAVHREWVCLSTLAWVPLWHKRAQHNLGAREIHLDDRELLLFLPISNVSIWVGTGCWEEKIKKSSYCLQECLIPSWKVLPVCRSASALLLLFYPCHWNVWESCLQGFFGSLYCCVRKNMFLRQVSSISF